MTTSAHLGWGTSYRSLTVTAVPRTQPRLALREPGGPVAHVYTQCLWGRAVASELPSVVSIHPARLCHSRRLMVPPSLWAVFQSGSVLSSGLSVWL